MYEGDKRVIMFKSLVQFLTGPVAEVKSVRTAGAHSLVKLTSQYGEW